MSIGADIKEVFDELGSPVHVYKYANGETYEEYVDTTFEVNHVYPWTSHYIVKAFLAYDTRVEAGDLITFMDEPASPQRFLVTAMQSELFEAQVVTKESVLYKCNAVAQIKRRTEARNADYELQVLWPTVNSGEYGFFTGQLESYHTSEEGNTVSLLDRNLLYISDHIDLRIEDRCVIKDSMDEVSGEVYEVELIETHRLPNIKICRLVDDSRE